MADNAEYFLGPDNIERSRALFRSAVDLGIGFKSQDEVRTNGIAAISPEALVDEMPEDGIPAEDVLEEFAERFMPSSYNFASPMFMGFPDAGNSVAAITGNLLADFMQQNMINQEFCSPSATFAEIAVIRWLREVVNYENPDSLEDIFDTGGVITGGGTTSNAIGIMLAREHFDPDAMTDGVDPNRGYKVVVPRGIGHYSVKSAQMWAGCGNNLVEVDTDCFRYDLDALSQALGENEGEVMAVVAYAGDSRTMTVDNFNGIADVVENSGQDIWMHADACHGFSLGFSDALRHKIDGIERFDSITTDPHKVMNAPYTISALLVREPQQLRTVASLSDLIMQEQFAFGQATPFIGSKSFMSIKLWFAMKNLGRKGFGEVIDARHQVALDLQNMIDDRDDFIRLNDVEINSVAFMFTDPDAELSVEELNDINHRIHDEMIKEGIMHLHQFTIPDDGVVEKGAILKPLRFMSGNPNITREHLEKMLEHVRELGQQFREAMK